MMVVPLVALLLVALVPKGLLASPSTVPAFLWSPHHELVSNNGLEGTVNYQVFSPKDLANSVISQAGWSNLLCKGKEVQKPLDLALLFVGRELHSSDLSLNKKADPALLDLLKTSFTRSNFSMAFPYVSASEEEKLENLLVSGFAEACGHDLGIGNVAFLGSCAVEDANHEESAALHSIEDFLTKRKEESDKGATDLVVFCNGDSLPSKNVDSAQSEGEILSKLVSSVEQSGAKYSVLYVSEPSWSIQYPYRELQRFLAESGTGNGSANSTLCDEVCQIKSSLLEGLLVGIVLLIILISGLCCMMGIDTPSRFEAPQES
ncbi:putative transmembrane protein [Senna tora]|uniref:Putative transmembrane protein n=1 Tax=Senna tora TaxID=362788 RepID=A0A835C6G6_9FABA|nr:putative transmembrane protein [Senna tora]